MVLLVPVCSVVPALAPTNVLLEPDVKARPLLWPTAVQSVAAVIAVSAFVPTATALWAVPFRGPASAADPTATHPATAVVAAFIAFTPIMVLLTPRVVVPAFCPTIVLPAEIVSPHFAAEPTMVQFDDVVRADPATLPTRVHPVAVVRDRPALCPIAVLSAPVVFIAANDPLPTATLFVAGVCKFPRIAPAPMATIPVGKPDGVPSKTSVPIPTTLDPRLSDPDELPMITHPVPAADDWPILVPELDTNPPLPSETKEDDSVPTTTPAAHISSCPASTCPIPVCSPGVAKRV